MRPISRRIATHFSPSLAFEGGALCEVVDVVLSDADGDGKLDKVVKNE